MKKYWFIFIFAISHGAFSQEPPLTDYLNPPDNLYIQSCKLNGEAWNLLRFPHSAFAKGGTLEIVLGDKPNKSRGIKGQNKN